MRALILALGLLLCVGQANAANAYKFYDVDVENAPAVLAATDAFMKSETDSASRARFTSTPISPMARVQPPMPL